MNKSLKEKAIELYELGKSYNEIKSILNCSKGVLSFHLSSMHEANNITKKKEKEILFKEVISDKSISRSDFLNKYGDKFTVKEKWKILSNYFPIRLKIKTAMPVADYHKIRRTSIKQELVDYKGGKCQSCGYDRCLRSLHFHHIDASLKNFNISAQIKKLKKPVLFNELDKCILLCSNCHYEIHEGLITIETMQI